MRVKTGLAEMLKGGVIMDVVDADQARIAEEAGAVAVMALERVPADIRVQGGVARMSDPGQDPRDPGDRHDPGDGEVPDRALRRGADPGGARGRLHRRVRGADTRPTSSTTSTSGSSPSRSSAAATNLGEALRRIAEGAAMIRTKGEAGTGDIVNAVTHMRAVFGGIRRLQSLREDELYAEAKELRAPGRARALGRRARPAAGRHVHRGRHRDARPTRRSACSSAPTVSSSAPGSSSRARQARRLRRLGKDVSRRARRSSRRRRTTPTRRSSPSVSAGLGAPMVGISVRLARRRRAARSPRLVALAAAPG